jgi:hypothetical protein
VFKPTSEALAGLSDEIALWMAEPPAPGELERLFAETDPAQALVKVVFTRERSWHFEAKSQPTNYYLQSITPFLAEIFEYGEFPAGGFLIVVSDGVHLTPSAPVFGFSKKRSDEKTLLLPDPFYLSTRGYEASLPLIESGRVPWSERASSCFWRGSSTGRSLGPEDWRDNQRIALCLLAKEINDPTFLDAKITDVVQCTSPEVGEIVRAAGLTGERVPVSTFLNYRYLIDIDGNSTAWGLFEKLYMGCVVLKVEGTWTQWFYPKLHPWKHYIPVTADLSDLIEKITWAREHDGECQEMISNCKQLVRELNYQEVVKHYREILSQVVSLGS